MQPEDAPKKGIALLKLLAAVEEDIRAKRYSGQNEVFARIKARLEQECK